MLFLCRLLELRESFAGHLVLQNNKHHFFDVSAAVLGVEDPLGLCKCNLLFWACLESLGGLPVGQPAELFDRNENKRHVSLRSGHRLPGASGTKRQPFCDSCSSVIPCSLDPKPAVFGCFGWFRHASALASKSSSEVPWMKFSSFTAPHGRRPTGVHGICELWPVSGAAVCFSISVCARVCVCDQTCQCPTKAKAFPVFSLTHLESGQPNSCSFNGLSLLSDSLSKPPSAERRF